MFSKATGLKQGLIILMMLTCRLLQGQQPVTISFFNESTSVPFTSILSTPIHPGIQVGTEFEWRNSSRFRLYPAINLGYMFHRNLFQGIYANVELGVDYKTGTGLNLKTKIGLGYLRTYATQQEFQLKNGQYESKKDRGNGRLMPSFTVGLGYDLRKDDPYSPEIFTLYQAWIEYPYSPGFIPLMGHGSVHIGTRFYTSK